MQLGLLITLSVLLVSDSNFIANKVTDSGGQSRFLTEVKNADHVGSQQLLPESESSVRHNNIRFKSTQFNSTENTEKSISRTPVNLSGQVQTTTGSGQADNKIYLYSSHLNTSYRTRSDQYGLFSIPHVVPANDYVLVVQPEGMYKKSVQKKLQIDALRSYINIQLEPLRLTSVYGTIRNPSGQPLSSFEFRIRSLEKRFWSRTIQTDLRGQFKVEDVPVGALEITKTYGQALIITGLNAVSNQIQPLNLTVDYGDASLMGTILDSNNNIVPGATVVLSWHHNENKIRSAVNRRVTSDINGRFEVSNIDGGLHNLVVTSSFGKPHKQEIDIPPFGQDLLLVLHDTAVSY